MGMGKRLLLTIFVLMSLCKVYAQGGSIAGRVYDSNTALEFATISVLKTSYAASADSNGYYQINNIPVGKYQVRVSYLGYENAQQEVSIEAGKTATLNITLVPLSSKLNEVVITGALKQVTKLESVTPVDVYTAKFFQRNPVTNLFDGLYNVPGLFADVDNGVSNTTDVQINGLEGNYTMYLIDGVPALSSLAGMYAINAFPMNIIDKVEVVKGASSTLYGSEAMAGVINIKTKDPRSAPRFSANVYLTSMLESYADFSTKYKLGKATAMLSVGTENFNTKWDVDKDGFLDIPYINRFNIYNKVALYRKDDKIANVYARYLYEDRFGGDKTMSPRWRGSTAKYGEAITTSQWQMGLQYQLPVAEKVMLQLDYTEHRQGAYYGPNKYDGIQLSGFSQLTWSKKIDSINDFLLGAAYRLMYFEDNTPLSDPANTGYARLVHMPAIFFEDEITIAHRHMIVLGARVEYSNRSNFAITPRLNYKWMSQNRKNVLRAGVGTAYRMPNVLNEGIGAMNGSRGILLEEDLKPESCISVNLNYTRVQEVKGGLLNIDASVFYTYFFNYIDPEYDEEPGYISYSNSKGATAAGFSINADFTFNYPLKVGVGLVYNYVFEVEEGENGEKEREAPAHQPPFIGNFYLSYTFAAPQLSIDWTGNLVTPMKLSTVPDDERPEKSPVYTIQNVQITKKFKNGIDIYFGIKNLFNFIQKEPILRPNDPFNQNVAVNNPNNYRFDTTYGFTTTQGIKGFFGLRYTLQ